MQSTKDFYRLLGLPRDASQDDIRKAHRKLVREHHPDATPDDRSSEERFKEIQRAYEVSDADKRREYDKRLRASSRNSSKPRARPRGSDREKPTASSMDLSDLLRKLTDLSSERSEKAKEGSSQLNGKEVTRLAKLLGVDVPRISELLGQDINRLSRLVGENIKMAARVKPEDARSDGFRLRMRQPHVLNSQ